MSDLFAGAEPERSLKELLLEGRLRSKLTIEAVAEKLGVSPEFYERLEEGARVPGSKWIPKLGRLLTIPLDALESAAENARAGRVSRG